jgi:hypothetical protein
MRKVLQRWFVIILVLALASLACQAIGGDKPDGEEQPTQAVPPTSEDVPTQPTLLPVDTDAPPQPEEYDTDFPLPEDVREFMKVGESTINFRTSMSMDEVIAFYRQAFSEQGLTERKVTTVINEKAFSLVFDGSPNGMAVVIQGFPVDKETVNVSVRYEDV